MKSFALVVLCLQLTAAFARPTGRHLSQVMAPTVGGSMEQPTPANQATGPAGAASMPQFGAPPAGERFYGVPSTEEPRVVPSWYTLWTKIRQEADVNLGSFNFLLDRSGLYQQLDDPNAEWTVFAPSDVAFMDSLASVPTNLQMLLDNMDAVTPILQLHIVKGRYTSEQLTDGQQLQTLNPDFPLTVTKNQNGVFVSAGNGAPARIVFSNVLGSNGYLHLVDSLIVPPELLAALPKSVAPGAEIMLPPSQESMVAPTTTSTGMEQTGATGTATGAQPSTTTGGAAGGMGK